MRMIILVLAQTCVSPLAAQAHESAGSTASQAIYVCERGVTIPATYITTSPDGAFAVLNVEGRQVTLAIARSGSGARYVSIDEEIGYRWHTKGDMAMLSYLAADDSAEEAILLRDCRMTDR